MIASLAVPLNAALGRPLVARLDNADGWLLFVIGPLDYLGLILVGPLDYNCGWLLFVIGPLDYSDRSTGLSGWYIWVGPLNYDHRSLGGLFVAGPMAFI